MLSPSRLEEVGRTNSKVCSESVNKNAASCICHSEHLDADGLVESVEDHLEPDKAHELLETALTEDDSEGYHSSACSEVSHDQ